MVGGCGFLHALTEAHGENWPMAMRHSLSARPKCGPRVQPTRPYRPPFDLDALCVLVVTPDGRSLPVEVMWHGELDLSTAKQSGPSRIRATLLVDLPTTSRKRQGVEA
jgi:hypothetical protein